MLDVRSKKKVGGNPQLLRSRRVGNLVKAAPRPRLLRPKSHGAEHCTSQLEATRLVRDGTAQCRDRRISDGC